MSFTRDFTLEASDGYPLAATLYGDAPRHAIVHGATGVPRRFYAPFAQALAARGFSVLTYDYRGVGGSRPASLRGFEARMRDWALLDMQASLDWVRARGATRIAFVGHSFGGQVAGLLERADAVSGMLTVSSQSGYWRLQGRSQKVWVAFHMHVTLPVLSTLFGYMPWRRLGAADDLPKAVALEWARWCRNPRYLLGDATLPLERYAGFDAPVLAYSIEDDDWGTAEAVDAMMSAYPNVKRRHLTLAAANMARLGHFGFFRAGASHLWDEPLDWLERVSAPIAPRVALVPLRSAP